MTTQEVPELPPLPGGFFHAIGMLTKEQCDALTHVQMVEVLRRRGDHLSNAAADSIAYLSAQDGLIERAQGEAEKLSAELAEVKRPLDEQMARLNARVVELNQALTQAVADAQRWFPMQHGPSIPWKLAEAIYAGYSAQYGTQQSLERLADRGGFSWGEVEVLYKDRHNDYQMRRAMDAAIEAMRQGAQHK
jgi:hypothetical protein